MADWLGTLAQTWPARMAQSGLAALKLPGDVYAGRVKPGEDEYYNRATDLAGLVMGGSYAAPAVKGGAGMGIRAYHGSPHDFDKFDLSKIGTGEGAQAYGHGLYFAENEGVAKSYKGMVPNNLHPLNPANFWTPAARPSGKGHMYEVNINAKPEQFLDWDKPLMQQPGVVQDLARNADLSHLSEGNRTRVMLEKFKSGQEQDHYLATGHTLHNALEDYGMKPRPELSAYLKDQGIPGIKYLDQGSRGAGQGSSNYVVFDDKLIDILKKYGLAGLGVTGAAAASQPDQAQAAPQSIFKTGPASYAPDRQTIQDILR